MLKSIANLTKLIVAATALTFLASCEMKGITGSGNVTTESRPITGEFRSVEVSHGLDLILEQSDKLEITVQADDNLQSHIKTTISNGVLTIKSDYNNYRDVTAKKVTVKIPNLESLQASSGTTVNSTNSIKGNELSINSSSGATVEIKIEVEKAICEASSGSHITVNGKAMAFEVSTSSGSGIDAKRLFANDVTAHASSGSNIAVHPLVSLNAEASSGGVINYHNEPKSLSKHTSSGGSVSKE